MNTDFQKNGDLLVIERQSYSTVLTTVIGICGIIIFTISVPLFLGLISEFFGEEAVWRNIFNETFLIIHFMLTLGIAMISVGFSKRSLARYRERIIFNNSISSVEVGSFAEKNSLYKIPYSSISSIRTSKREGGPDYGDIYSLEIVKKEGSSFWLTGFVSAPEKLKNLAAEAALHTGLGITDDAGLGIEQKQVKYYNEVPDSPEEMKAEFVEYLQKNGCWSIRLKSGKNSLLNMFMAFILYLFFFSVPFYILNIFVADSIPAIVHLFTGIFVFLWSAILILTLTITLKDYKIIYSHDKFTIIVFIKNFPFINIPVSIPKSLITQVRINRMENGILNLSLVYHPLNDSAVNLRIKFLNISLHRFGRKKPAKKEKEIFLWEIAPATAPGYAPGISDMLFVENIIRRAL